MIKHLSMFVMLLPTLACAAEYELQYEESEPGVEPYTSRLLISDRYLRIDDLSDDSGYILYDDKLRKVFSISHHNRSTLVIEAGQVVEPGISDGLQVNDTPLKDAPRISGKLVHDYRVMTEASELCTHIQYVPGLLQQVGAMMHAYQAAMVANQVRTLSTTPSEYLTPCMLSDQVYFDGKIYSEGLPITESRSNGRERRLQTYSKKNVDDSLFLVPDYRQFSLE